MDDFLLRFHAKIDEITDFGKMMFHMVNFIHSKDLTGEFEEYLNKYWDNTD